MQGNQLFEYAIIRIVPQVEREEFINAGVILYCKQSAFLQMRHLVHEERLLALFPDVDLGCIKANLEAFQQICNGNAPGSPIAALDIASRFRWLTAKRSTVIQCSPVHPGMCSEPEKVLERIFEKMVY